MLMKVTRLVIEFKNRVSCGFMMNFLLITWFALAAIFVGLPLLYYSYTSKISAKPWNLKFNSEYQPSVSIFIPMHNEEKIINQKIENLYSIKYPPEKMEIIVVDDGSTDNSVNIVEDLLKIRNTLNVKVLKTGSQFGKSKALNFALKSSINDIIVVSDADCFWKEDTLANGLSYLADPQVGAVTGLEVLLNSNQSFVTQREAVYNSFVHNIRVGESKIYSTIIFQGGFGAYKRSCMSFFDDKVDDSGTALKITQQGLRTLLVPEAVFFTASPTSWVNMLKTKFRRASHLLKVWKISLGLLVKQGLVVPKKIVVPEIYLHMISPIILPILLLLTAVVSIEFPVIFLLVLLSVSAILMIGKLRMIFVETLVDNGILLAALFASFFLKNDENWKPLKRN